MKKPLEELGAEDVNRILAEKGLFAIFDFMKYKK